MIIDQDIPAVIALWERCDLTRPWNDPVRDLNLARATSDAVVLVGYVGEKLAASVMVGFDGHRGWVYYLSVHPERRGSGLGRSMMDAAEIWLAAQGAPKLQLMKEVEDKLPLGKYPWIKLVLRGGYPLRSRSKAVGMVYLYVPCRRPPSAS